MSEKSNAANLSWGVLAPKEEDLRPLLPKRLAEFGIELNTLSVPEARWRIYIYYIIQCAARRHRACFVSGRSGWSFSACMLLGSIIFESFWKSEGSFWMPGNPILRISRILVILSAVGDESVILFGGKNLSTNPLLGVLRF